MLKLVVQSEMITVDNREHHLIAALCAHNIQHTVAQMPLGDIRIGDEWLIERKTISDLTSSIVDGRFEEQRARLRAQVPHIRVGYLIEGKPDRSLLNGGLVAALASLSMEFAMFISDSPATSALQLQKIAHGQKAHKTQADATRLQATHKIQDQSPRNILQTALMNIRGVGTVTAATIAGAYDSVAQFIAAGATIDTIQWTSGRRPSENLRSSIKKAFGCI